MIWSKHARYHDLLSDREQIAFYFAIMLPGVFEIREQFPLSLCSAQHELAVYCAAYLSIEVPGTRDIAAEMAIRHPTLRKGEDEEPWQPSTDLLITVLAHDGKWSLVAVSVKPRNGLDRKRIVELQKLEQAYWKRRSVQWLLITPDQYLPAVGDCLRCSAAWVVSEERVADAEMTRCSEIVGRHVGSTLSHVLNTLCTEMRIPLLRAQQVFWQSVWYRQLPLDLNRSWRPSDPIALLTPAKFRQLNPLAAGRSACFS